MLLVRLDVRLRESKRLAKQSASLGGDHDQAGSRRAVSDGLPLVCGEISFASHLASPFVNEKRRRLAPTASAPASRVSPRRDPKRPQRPYPRFIRATLETRGD